MDYKKTGEFLKSLRKANGLTQEEVSNHLLVSPKTISRWECGDGLPDINIISDVAALYNVTVDEILKGEKSVKEENLKEETINLKNKKRDKALVSSAIKPFNIFFIIAISLSLLFLLVGIIVSFFYVFIGLIIILAGIVVPTILLLIGRIMTKERIKDNEDVVTQEVKDAVKNKLFFRTLNFIDVLCISLIPLAIVCLATGETNVIENVGFDLAYSILIFIVFYLIVRLPLIGAKSAKMKKPSVIAIICLSIFLTSFFFWLTYSKYNGGNRVFFSYYQEQYFDLPIERRFNFPDINFYVILSLIIVLTLVFLLIKKAYLLFIPLCLTLLAEIPAVFDLKRGFENENRYFYGISPSITGVLLFITGVIFIIILMKKNKEEKITQ